MNADCSFIKGNSHIICQDYALAKANTDYGYAIVSDGCSVIKKDEGAIPHPFSDISARMVALCAKTTIDDFIEFKYYTGVVTSNFDELMRVKLLQLSHNLKLGVNIGDATLNLAYVYKDMLALIMMGDGVVVIEHDNEYEVIVRTFEPNTPSYFSYQLSPTLETRYSEASVERKDTRFYIEKGTWNITPSITSKTIADTKTSLTVFGTTTVQSVTVFSDGIEDLRKGAQLPLAEALTRFFPYISTSSDSFVKRRMRSFERSLKKDDVIINDDLSVASLSLTHENS